MDNEVVVDRAVIFYNDASHLAGEPAFDWRCDAQVLPAGSVVVGFMVAHPQSLRGQGGAVRLGQQAFTWQAGKKILLGIEFSSWDNKAPIVVLDAPYMNRAQQENFAQVCGEAVAAITAGYPKEGD